MGTVTIQEFKKTKFFEFVKENFIEYLSPKGINFDPKEWPTYKVDEISDLPNKIILNLESGAYQLILENTKSYKERSSNGLNSSIIFLGVTRFQLIHKDNGTQSEKLVDKYEDPNGFEFSIQWSSDELRKSISKPDESFSVVGKISTFDETYFYKWQERAGFALQCPVGWAGQPWECNFRFIKIKILDDRIVITNWPNYDLYIWGATDYKEKIDSKKELQCLFLYGVKKVEMYNRDTGEKQKVPDWFHPDGFEIAIHWGSADYSRQFYKKY